MTLNERIESLAERIYAAMIGAMCMDSWTTEKWARQRTELAKEARESAKAFVRTGPPEPPNEDDLMNYQTGEGRRR